MFPSQPQFERIVFEQDHLQRQRRAAEAREAGLPRRPTVVVLALTFLTIVIFGAFATQRTSDAFAPPDDTEELLRDDPVEPSVDPLVTAIIEEISVWWPRSSPRPFL